MKRPWEGTALGVVDIIATIFAFLGAIGFLFLQGLLSGFMNSVQVTSGDVAVSAASTGIFSMFASLGLVIGVILIAFAVLSIFLARGSFKGQKWTVIVNLIFGILGLLSALSSLGGTMANQVYMNLAIDAFVIYCSVMCLKNAYYNK